MLEVTTKTKPNPNWAKLPLFDRSKWDTLPFGAFADCISERAHPVEFADAIYVGLEHLDPENLHIRRWGKGSDVEGVKLRFYKGDIIFGRRRAYQRKLAVAEVDGICSAHAMVLRAKPELCLPEFLPFLMMSDAFMKRAVEISVGSLSPTISWGVLKQQQFALPPLDQQRRIAELLWAVDDDLQHCNDLIGASEDVMRTMAEEECWNAAFELKPIVSIAHQAIGSFVDGDWIESKDQSPSGIRLIQLADIGEGEFLNKSDRWISDETFHRLKCTEVLPGDILISRMAEPIGRACIIPDLGQKMITGVDCTIVRLDSQKHDASYWISLTNTRKWRNMVESNAGGSTRMRISRKRLEALQVPIPDIQYQQQVSSRINQVNQALLATRSKADSTMQLMQSILGMIS